MRLGKSWLKKKYIKISLSTGHCLFTIFLFSLLWKTTCLQRPHHSVVVIHRFDSLLKKIGPVTPWPWPWHSVSCLLSCGHQWPSFAAACALFFSGRLKVERQLKKPSDAAVARLTEAAGPSEAPGLETALQTVSVRDMIRLIGKDAVCSQAYHLVAITSTTISVPHDDVMTWLRLLSFWPFVRESTGHW